MAAGSYYKPFNNLLDIFFTNVESSMQLSTCLRVTAGQLRQLLSSVQYTLNGH